MWIRKQWEKQAEIAQRILDEEGSKLSNKKRAELEDIIKYVENLKQYRPAVAIEIEERWKT